MAASRRSGLGRGLDALLAVDGPPAEGFALVAIGSITPNPRQPRTSFDEEGLEALASSIVQVGILQPLVVGPPVEDGTYPLIAGERRLRAARIAGLKEVPVLVRPTDEQSSLADALIENVQREDLGALEEAAAYTALLEDFRMTHDAVAKRVGKSRATVTNTIRLLKLPAKVQSLLASGELSAGAAKALLGVTDPAAASSIAEQAAREGWSVRRVEDAVRDLRDAGGSNGSGPPSSRDPRPAQIIALEERLSDRLGSPVRIVYGKDGGGRLTVRFGSVDDLERIYRSLIGAQAGS